KYIPKEITGAFSLGNADITGDSSGRLIVRDTKSMDDFGKKMGYHNDDQIVSLNGEEINFGNANIVVPKIFNTVKEGDMLTVVVKRRKADEQTETVTLSSPVTKVEEPKLHQLKFDEHATPEQLNLRKVWLNTVE
ncbi:MAG: hypothetical protein ABJA71_10900, partial [Ginsengibacter sp.]